jgi:hypothetical protein
VAILYIEISYNTILHSAPFKRPARLQRHSNAGAAGANNRVVIQHHVSAIAAEHETKDLIVSYMKGIWLFTSRIGQPPSHSNTSAAGANNSVVIQRHVPVNAAEHGTNSIS